MAKITVTYDTEQKTLMMMKDGNVIEDPRYISFDHYGDMSEDGKKQYSMRVVHLHRKDGGMMVETITTASDTVAGPGQCKDGESMEECKKRVGKKYKSKG